MPTGKKLPGAVRWGALIWLAIWIPAYSHAWGAANFLHLCDVAVILTCIGLWTSNALLLASQAVSSIVVDLIWTADAASAVFSNHQLIGGTEYLLDPHTALWIRLLSLFHVVLPVVLLWALARVGYHRRAWALQTAIAVATFIASRFTNPVANINYAFHDPFWHRQLGPVPLHVLLCILAMVIVVYLPTHLILLRLYCRKTENQREAAS
ncbi:MAG: hypothetical protein ACRD8A_03525 [Candidatus Acidiferrales bacterium]